MLDVKRDMMRLGPFRLTSVLSLSASAIKLEHFFKYRTLWLFLCIHVSVTVNVNSNGICLER